jgi:predicted TIM-barrel enzyme
VLIAEPADAQYVPDHTLGVAALFGASSVERLPTEVAITESMRRSRRITRTAGVAG